MGHFKTALSVVVAVDLSIIAHGLLVGAYSTHNFLCGPRGRICAKTGSSLRQAPCCMSSCVIAGASAIGCLVRLVAATARGIFAVAACLLLWISVFLMVAVSFACAFSVVVMLGVETGCAKLSDADSISRHLGNTTADILQQKFDESGLTTILDVAQASEQDAAARATSWMPPPLAPLMPSNIGFARALRDKVATLVQVAKTRAAATVEEQAQEYLLLVADFCQPLLATIAWWRQALVAGLCLVAAQVLMLIAQP